MALFVTACPSLEAREDASAPRNVLLVSIDSLRADRLGSYGHVRDTTPHLDRLAREGVRFANALSPTSWTLPAHATLLTGRDQEGHGVITVKDRLRDTIATLPKTFRDSGYETVGFYSGPFLHPVFGFDQGFERYESCMTEVDAEPLSVETLRGSHADVTNAAVERAFRKWLGAKTARPFFAFVHLWDVHYDYRPPEPYASMFTAPYGGTLDGRDIVGDGFPLDASPADVAYLLSLYDGEVRATDQAVGHLLEALEDRGLLKDTLVVVTADHGEEFKDHGAKGHQHSLYDELIRVPLILWSPGLLSPAVVETPVGLRDVAPTIAALTGTEVPDGSDGTSLLGLLRSGDARRDPVVSVLYRQTEPSVLAGAIRDGDRKVIFDARTGEWTQFDLAVDPAERGGFEPTDRALAETLRRHLTPAEPIGARSEPSKIPPALEERLRRLGYATGESS